MANPTAYDNGMGMAYPLTKMNFRVSVSSVEGAAAFNQVTGLDATVDVIEFRQGNAASLAPVKIPGLVKHGNVTLRFGNKYVSPLFALIIRALVDDLGEDTKNPRN